MHELAIAESVVEAVRARTDDRQVTVVRLRVGRLSGVLPDALTFAFELATDGTPLAGAALELEQPGGAGHCRTCGLDFELADLILLCPCGSADVEVVAGRESSRWPPWRWPEMCSTCGCGADEVRFTTMAPGADGHAHGSAPGDGHGPGRGHGHGPGTATGTMPTRAADPRAGRTPSSSSRPCSPATTTSPATTGAGSRSAGSPPST